MTSSRLGALLLVTLGVAVLWLRFNVPADETGGVAHQFALHGDLITYYLPMAELVASRLAQGELPLWNPAVCSGIPLLATLQTGILHPATWGTAWLPAHQALSIRMWLACWLAGVLATWMFRAFGVSKIAACAGGVLYVFACVLGQTLWPPAALTLATFPWTLLCVQRLLEIGTQTDPTDTVVLARWWCGLAAGVALQLLAGFPQYFVYGTLIVGAVVAQRVVTTAAGRVSLLWLASAFVVGAGVSAVQLLPSLELAQASVRGGEMTPTALHYLTIWDPYSATDVVRAMFDPSPALASFHLGNSGGYLGIGVLMLAAVAVASGWRTSWTWLWLIVAATSLVLSNGMLGVTEPAYRVFAELPLVGSFRTPERLRFVTVFAFIVLAVQGFEVLRNAGADARTVPRSRLRFALFASALLLVSALVLMGAAAASWRVVAALVLAIALSEAAAPNTLRRAAALGLFALLVLDVFLATDAHGSFRQIPVEMSNRYGTPDRSRMLPAGFFERQRDAVGFARLELLHYRPHMATAPSNGGYRVSCYEPLVPAQWPALDAALRDKPGIGATLSDLPLRSASAFYDVAGVERILQSTPAGPVVVRNDDALPRAYVTGSYRVATQERAFAHLREGDFDFQRGVLIDREADFPSRPPAAVVAARILEYAPERVVIEAVSDTPALLVLSDSDYPGWRATRDGKPARILRANGVYRAIELSGGRSRVVFDYVPRSLQVGGAISLASLSLLVCVGLWSRSRRSEQRARRVRMESQT